MTPKFTPQSFSRLLFLLLLSIGVQSHAQLNLEFDINSYPSAPSGPSTAPVSADFRLNTTGSTFTAFTPTINITASFASQTYTGIPNSTAGTGLTFGATSGSTSQQPVSRPVWALFNNIGSPTNAMFTSNPYGTSGTGIDVTVNHAFNVYCHVRPLQSAASPTNGRYLFGTITFTFNRAISNPVLHVVGLGGTTTASVGGSILGFTTELECITGGVTLAKIGGNANLNVTANKILNSAANPAASSLTGAATGSIRVTGNNITSMTFQVYVRGDGAGTTWENTAVGAGQAAGDQWLLGFSMSEPTISGNVYDDADGLTDNLVDGTPTNVGGVMFASLVDLTTGFVVLTTPVQSDGTYLFQDILPPAYPRSYNVVLSNTQGTIGAVPPATNLPANWVHTGTHIGAGAGGTNTNGTLSGITLTDGFTVVTDANFGIEQLPSPSTIVASSQVNPGGTTQATMPAATFAGTDPDGTVDSIRITGFPSNATTIVINGTSYTSGTFPGGGVTVVAPGGVPGVAITVDPVDGAVTVDIPYVTIDNAHKESPTTGHAQKPFTLISLSGIVFDDANGLTDNIVNGAVTNAGGLNAILTDVGTGLVIASTSVSVGGTYSFSNLNGGNYTVEISTNTATIGVAAPAVALPANWVSTGEHLGAAAGSDGTVNSILPVGAINTNTTNANFGIEQLPSPSTIVASSQVNPGGTTQVTIPAATFAGTDPDGTVDSIRITAFPSNATTIVINGTSYTSGTFPVGGVTVVAPGGVPGVTITVDPVDGAVTVDIPYVTIDNAHKESPTTGHAQKPFTLISLSGNVFDDANALIDNTVNGAGTNAGGLNAILTDVGTGLVIASTSVSVGGTYSFSNLNGGSYTVEISTNTATIGVAAPAVALPANWVTTGEHLGAAAGSDGTVNGILPVGAIITNTTNANFGIEQLPSPSTIVAASQVNPGGTTQANIPASTFAGTDPDGTVDSIRITGFPTNATTIVINGTSYTSGTFPGGGVTVVAPGGVPGVTITVDPVDGAVTVDIPYVTIDNAHKESPTTGHAQKPFTTVSISGTLFDDFTGVNNSLVDGVVTNVGNTMFAILVSGNNVELANTPIANDGTYSFSGVNGGTYTVQIGTSAGTNGIAPPAVSLPSGWVTTSEAISPAFNDGTINSITSVTVTTSNVTGINFGIEQPAPAAAKGYTGVLSGGVNPIQPVTIPSTAGAGTYGNRVDMAGTASSGGTPGQLTGSDPDGNSGGVLSLGSGSGASISFTVNPSTYSALDGSSLPVATGMMLQYNGVQLQPGGCQGADIGNGLCSSYNGVTSQWEIANYNESLLKILAKGSVQTISFNYGWKDAASKQGTAALYSVTTSTPLAIHLLSFDAAATGASQATLNWNASNETSGDVYGIERSTDGISFTELGTTPAKGSSSLASYNFVDNVPAQGINYYRLHLLGADGSSSYSLIRSLTFGNAGGSISVYPNPVVNGSFKVDLNGMTGSSEINIIDYSGRSVVHQSVTGSVPVSTSGWASGLYTITVINNGQLYTTIIHVQ